MSATKPLLGFSTLACPEWPALEVVDRAAAMGAGGIEWRGGPDGHAGPGAGRAALQAMRHAMDDRGLVAIAVTAYTTFIAGDPGERAASLDDLVRHAEAAALLGAPWVRVFLGERTDAVSDAELLDRAAEGLTVAAGRLAGSGVGIAIEPHDELVASPVVAPLLERVGGQGIGVIWDLGNTWAAGEPPAVGLAAFRPWLRYVQIKDGTGRGATWRLTRIGQGEVPLRDALAGLVRAGPLPPLSIEWERPWAPHLPSAGEALPEGFAHIRSLLDQVSHHTKET